MQKAGRAAAKEAPGVTQHLVGAVRREGIRPQPIPMSRPRKSHRLGHRKLRQMP